MRIIQFGTGRFLQAHAALFVHEAREAGQQIGPITVVQTSNAIDRAARVAAFGRPDGYPVIVRGIRDGEVIERRTEVRSVDSGLSALADWPALMRLFAMDAAIVVSNMGDAGYQIAPIDRRELLREGRVLISFPGKLVRLLYHRWCAGGDPLTVLPCELVHRNGDVLGAAVLDLANANAAPAGFASWIERHVIFANTLVDRIVSESIEPVGAVAEPYALWAIERQSGLDLPFSHPSIVLTDDLEPLERLKLHILNLGHTFLAEIWTSESRPPDETVRAILADDDVRCRLDELYTTEIIQGFAARGMGREARDYVSATLERFSNPFLDHRVADIAQNHAVKVERRVNAFLDWIADRSPRPATPILRVLAQRHASTRPAP